MNSVPSFDADLLRRYDRPGPRYTSYPTAPQFGSHFNEAMLRDYIRRSNTEPIPRQLSLYVHVPYCFSPCFYCGCNRIITRDLAKGRTYLERLIREIEEVGRLFDRDRDVMQLHLGGGTPNFLRPGDLRELIDSVGRHFHLSSSARRDFSSSWIHAISLRAMLPPMRRWASIAPVVEHVGPFKKANTCSVKATPSTPSRRYERDGQDLRHRHRRPRAGAGFLPAGRDHRPERDLARALSLQRRCARFGACCAASRFRTSPRWPTRMPGLQQQLFRLLSQDIGKAALLAGNFIGRRTHGGFLISLSRRYAARGFSASASMLTMTRTDIANYLRLASETVSRVFRRFQDEGLIRVDRREIELSIGAGLEQLARSVLRELILRHFAGHPRPLDLDQSAAAACGAASAHQHGRCVMSANRRLWTGLAACCSRLVRRAAVGRRRNPSRHAADARARRHRQTARRSTRAPTSRRGRQVWQSIGGQQLGSIWGHGSYVAPDWTADWLHREATGVARPRAAARHVAGVRANSRPRSRPRSRRDCSRGCARTPTTPRPDHHVPADRARRSRR